MKKLYFSLLTLLFFFGANAQIVNIPDPVFKAKLLSASTNGIASTQTPNESFGTVTTVNAIDTNDDGEIQVSEAVLIKYLNISFTNLTSLEGINAFINLESFYFNENNQLSTLNLSGLPNLKYLDCSNNQITSLNVSGLVNLKQFYCEFNLLPSLNLNGLTALQKFNCRNNQLPSLNVSGLTNLQLLDCHGNQLPNLDLTGLSNLQSLYCSYNQLPNLILTGLPNLQILECSHNLLSNLNAQNATSLSVLRCQNNPQLTALNIKNGISLNTLNSISLVISNNPNLQYICADEYEIDFVQNKINAAGYLYTCQVNSYCSFDPAGTYYIIQGNNKLDINAVGCDASDGIYPNLKFLIANGPNNGTLISNSSGNYSIPVSAGSHTFTPQFENPSYFTSSPTSASVTFPATTSPFVQNFCITPNGVHHDLEVVVIPLVPARPGFDATYKIKYKNKGNLNETATLVFNYSDSVLDYISSTLAPTTISSGSLSWNIGTVTPFQTGEFVVTLNVNSPMETPAVNAGNILIYTAVINGLNTDETTSDNTFSFPQTVVNSYDPNDKTCLEGTTINPSMIGEYVHYQIRFENTGTFPAENIVVKDMIDTAKFDIATLQITDASHSCVTRITNPNKVEFIFEDINLPFDDATNDGYVVFKIKTKSTLVVGNSISNLANIYFDYNFPIVTNTATSTFQALATNEFNSNNALTLYPIPVKDNLNFSLKNNEITSSISIYNLLGQLIQTVTNPSNSIDVSNLQSGSYLIKVTTDKGISSGKFIKE
jgi:Secretion system C-terminal sorting domain/Leucine Rich repeats (2 copies)/Domain of unknown function DUF11